MAKFGKVFETDAGLFVIYYHKGKKKKLYKVKLSHIRTY